MSLPNPSTAAAIVLIDELARNGVRDIVVAPGSRSAALAMAAAGHPEIRIHVEIDERSAGFFALGIGRSLGRPAAVVTTSGTATTNLYPAVAEADIDSVPLILLTADRPPELHHVGANQTMDQLKLYGDRVRWFCGLGVPEPRPDSNLVWRSTVCQAVARARGFVDGLPGPVHVNLPFREPSVPLTDDGRSIGIPFDHDTEGRADGAPWTRVGETGWRLTEVDPIEAERVLIAVAAGAHHRSLVDDAAQHGWPVIAEPQSGARTPGAITTAHHLTQSESTIEEMVPDVVIEIGRVGLSRPVRAFLDRAPERIVIAPHWADASRTARAWGSGWVPWPKESTGPGPWLERWLAAEATARAALDDALDRSGLIEPRVARDTALAVPADGHLVVASSMPIRDLDLAMAPSSVHTIANRGVSGIDGFVSTALGVAATSVGPVVALAGDLSVLHDSNGFLVEPRPDVVLVVVNNDGGGIFSFLPQSGFPESFEQVFGTPHGRAFADLARFHDLGHRLVADADALIPAIQAGLDSGGVQLIEAQTDRGRNVDQHRALTEAVLVAL